MRGKRIFVLFCLIVAAFFATTYFSSEGEQTAEAAAVTKITYVYKDTPVLSASYFTGKTSDVKRALRARSVYPLYVDLLTATGDEAAVLEHILPAFSQDVLALSEAVYEAPKDATAHYQGGESPFRYEAERCGVTMDVPLLIKSVLESLGRRGGSLTVTVPTLPVQPSVTLEGLKRNTGKISEYATSVVGSGAGRLHNIRLALSFLHGVQIPPGGSFSFNDCVGKRSVERGFKQAKIISNGEYILGFGGGVCQVSTNLYLCALLCGRRVTQRSHHSLPASYVPMGQDAMVSSVSDLRFENDSDYPLFIAAELVGNSIKIAFYGQALFDEIHISSVTVKRVEMPIKIVAEEENSAENANVQNAEADEKTEEVADGTERQADYEILVKGSAGYLVRTYCEYLKGQTKSRVLISQDYYKERLQIVRKRD